MFVDPPPDHQDIYFVHMQHPYHDLFYRQIISSFSVRYINVYLKLHQMEDTFISGNCVFGEKYNKAKAKKRLNAIISSQMLRQSLGRPVLFPSLSAKN